MFDIVCSQAAAVALTLGQRNNGSLNASPLEKRSVSKDWLRPGSHRGQNETDAGNASSNWAPRHLTE